MPRQKRKMCIFPFPRAEPILVILISGQHMRVLVTPNQLRQPKTDIFTMNLVYTVHLV